MPPKTRGLRSTIASTAPHVPPSKSLTSDSNNPKAIEPDSAMSESGAPSMKVLSEVAISQAPSLMDKGESDLAPMGLDSSKSVPDDRLKTNKPESPKLPDSPESTAEASSDHLPVPVSNASKKDADEPSTSSESTESTGAIANIFKGTLANTMDECRAQGKAQREKLSQHPIVSTPPTPSHTLDKSLVAASGYTGTLLVDRVIDDMEHSRYCLWLGESKKIMKNCEWVKNATSNTQTLVWKKNSTLQPTGGDGSVLIGWMGQVSGEQSNLNPDAGWIYPQPDYDSRFALKKRNVALVSPGDETRFPRHIWNEQMKGYNALVDHTRRTETGKSPIGVGYSFYDSVNACLRARSPLFLPISTIVNNSDDKNASDEESDTDNDENGIPETHRYPTWSITLPRVEALFEELINQGHQPQILNARDRFDTLVHPNQVHSTLNGTIAYVYATLERHLFTQRGIPGGKAWHFYANLVKVQALKAPLLAPKPNTLKRKNTHAYSMIHAYSEIAGSSSKRPKL